VVGQPEASRTEALGAARSQNRLATGDDWSRGGRGVEIWGKQGSNRWGLIGYHWRVGTCWVASRVGFGFMGLAR
jgi:hypothetical protein